MSYEEYVQNMIKKLNNKEKLTEEEIESLVEYEFEHEIGDENRWDVEVLSYINFNDKYYCVEWDKGKTECQENYYHNQPYEVEKKEYDKVVHVVEWVKI